jgi:polyisoprenoid-binding protein YceI
MNNAWNFITVVAVGAVGVAMSAGALGCESNSGRNNSKATRQQVLLPLDASTHRTPPLGAKAVFYKFSAPDSSIAFTGAKVTKKHEGSFRSFEGTIGLVAGDPLMSAVQVAIDTDSLTIEPAKLAAHLKGPDFFDVAKFPKATFASTTIRPGDAPSTYNVTGRFELHGVSKPLTFPATIRIAGGGVEADAEFKINRKDYGIVYPGMPDDLISDDVAIKLTIRAKPASAVAPAASGGGAPADAHSGD